MAPLAAVRTDRLFGLNLIVLVATMLLLCPRVANAQDSKTSQDATASAPVRLNDIQVFTASFKAAVKERNCFKLAALTSFPLRVNYGNRPTRLLWNRTALCRYFPEIFTPETTRMILEQGLPKEMGWRGWMFGNGVIWIQEFVDDAAKTTDRSRYIAFQAANLGLDKSSPKIQKRP